MNKYHLFKYIVPLNTPTDNSGAIFKTNRFGKLVLVEVFWWPDTDSFKARGFGISSYCKEDIAGFSVEGANRQGICLGIFCTLEAAMDHIMELEFEAFL